MKILYVEDDVISTVILKTFLSKMGENNVDVASDGINGLEKVKSNNYDLIFSDVHMPNMDGIVMGKEIRKINLIIPIIFVTAYSDIYITLHEISPYVISKPLNIEIIKKYLEKLTNVNTRTTNTL